MGVCVCVCVRACVRVCVCVCVTYIPRNKGVRRTLADGGVVDARQDEDAVVGHVAGAVNQAT